MLALDYKSRTPLCDQLCQQIIRMAACGVLPLGSQLPSVRAMATELGINPNTVQKAYHILEQDGILETVPGKGSFLTAGDAAQKRLQANALAALDSTLRAAVDSGLAPCDIARHCVELLRQQDERKEQLL